MSILGGLFDAATKVVGGIVGGGNSPIGGLVEKAGDLLGGLTGDKIGDRVGDVVGDILGNDGIGDKIGDVLGGALGGDHSVAGGLLDKVGGILGHGEGGSPLVGVAGLVGGEGGLLGGLLGGILDKAGDALGGAAGVAGDLFSPASGIGEAAGLTLPESMSQLGGSDMSDLAQLLAEAGKPTTEPAAMEPAMGLEPDLLQQGENGFGDMSAASMPDTSMDTSALPSMAGDMGSEMASMPSEMMQMQM